MSQENVEIVRAAIDAANRGDWDAVLKDAPPDFEFDFSRALGPERGVYGRDQTQRVFAEWAENSSSFRIEPHEFIEVGEQVVVPWTLHALGPQGIELTARVTWTFTIRDGVVVRLCMYQERQDALDAAGLSE